MAKWASMNNCVKCIWNRGSYKQLLSTFSWEASLTLLFCFAGSTWYCIQAQVLVLLDIHTYLRVRQLTLTLKLFLEDTNLRIIHIPLWFKKAFHVTQGSSISISKYEISNFGPRTCPLTYFNYIPIIKEAIPCAKLCIFVVNKVSNSLGMPSFAAYSIHIVKNFHPWLSTPGCLCHVFRFVSSL